jgi:hypothetical protein
MFTEKTSLIIPTRNRIFFLEELLKQLDLYKVNFLEKLIIDSSHISNSNYVKNLSKKHMAKYFRTKASTSFQRNYGLKVVNKKAKYIMFLDDDVIFFKDSFYQMNRTIENNLKASGYGFNQITPLKDNLIELLKKTKFTKFINLYDSDPGKLTKSGWHTKIQNLRKDIYADWIYTTACIYKFEDIKNYRFDETFGRYSYLEDLDFSLNLKRNNQKIIVSHLAKYKHPLNIDRSSFKFGILEIVNRFKIVQKNNINLIYFVNSAIFRFIYSLAHSLIKLNPKYLFRAFGNIYGLLNIFLKKNKNAS